MTGDDTTARDEHTLDEDTRRRWPWWAPWSAAATIAALVIGIGTWIVAAQDDDSTGMGGMAGAEGMPPPVTGYYDGERIHFLHTEASDREVATMLTEMMGGSPVIHTPALAEAGDEVLAPVYVFTDGVRPAGPRGPFDFQPDVFDSVPGQPGYTPLRSVHLVAWRDGVDPRLLTTAGDIDRAEQTGEITVSEPGIVVNMPIVTWPGGRR